MPPPSRRARQPVFVRGAILSGYESLARSCGLDPAALLRQVGLTLADARQPERQFRASTVFRLIELSATRSGRSDFGLQLPMGRRLSYWGRLGLRVREQPTVRSALLDMASHMNLHSTCIDVTLAEGAGVAEYRMVIDPDGEMEYRQAAEAALAGMLHLLRLLLGSTWRPLHAQFVHPRPAQVTTHAWLFDCPLIFSGPWHGLGLRGADLEREIPLADTGFADIVGALSPAPISAAPDAARIRHAMLNALATERCSAESIAAALGVHRRTLHRVLAREGTTYGELLMQVRRELAAQYLPGRMPLADIAAWLGFGDPTALSRWCRQNLGASPRALRAQAQAATAAGARMG